MTALPEYVHPLTAREYAALPEDEGVRYELAEGWLMMSPRPKPRHQRGSRELSRQLVPQLPALEVLQEVDIDLELAPPEAPGTVRVPDVVVISREAYERVDGDDTLLRANEVLLAVEFFSPGSTRIDTVVKHHEYADAGIGHYWMIDLHDGPSLVSCHLAGEFGYQNAEPRRGIVAITEPFAAQIDLDALR